MTQKIVFKFDVESSFLFLGNLHKWARLKCEYSISNQTQTCKTIFFDRFWMKETEFPGFKAIGNFLIKISPTA